MYTGDRVMGHNDGGAQAKTDFNPKRFYTDLEHCLALQVSRDEVTWERAAPRAGERAEVVLNLSCGVQATPHLMRVQVAVFDALGVNFVATAGTQFCCGRPFGRGGDTSVGDRVAARSIDRLAAWRPTVNVQCCGSCLVEYGHHVDQIAEETGTAPFEVVHITQFLLDKLRELGDSVPWAATQRSTPLRVLLHAEGVEVHSTKEEARIAVIETLDLIPGVEFAGMVESPSIGAPCASKRRPGDGNSDVHTVLSDLTPAEYRRTQAELEEQARAVGAEAIVTHHHKCHREWSKFGSDRLPVIQYQSLLAKALGVSIPDRFQSLWRLDDPAEILEQTRPQWQSWGITEDEARSMVTRFFVPAYASQVQDCPCENDCIEKIIGRSQPGAGCVRKPT